MKSTERLIFHIDVNSAFLSWESARRVSQGLPDLREIPSCVGGDPKKRTGIVVAKSIPAKKYGIQSGEPLAMALRKCPNLVIVPSDFELYDKCSRFLLNKAGFSHYSIRCQQSPLPGRCQKPSDAFLGLGSGYCNPSGHYLRSHER